MNSEKEIAVPAKEEKIAVPPPATPTVVTVLVEISTAGVCVIITASFLISTVCFLIKELISFVF